MYICLNLLTSGRTTAHGVGSEIRSKRYLSSQLCIEATRGADDLQ
jgi:hypothetical protein